jgi:hypothetical protein
MKEQPPCGLNYWRATGDPLGISRLFSPETPKALRNAGGYVLLDGR